MNTTPVSWTPRMLTMVRMSQHAEAELQGVGLQAGHGGDERAHAGGDAHGGGEDVVDHQRRGGQQARAFTQVLRWPRCKSRRRGDRRRWSGGS